MIDDCPLSGTESDDGVRSLDSAPSTAMDRTMRRSEICWKLDFKQPGVHSRTNELALWLRKSLKALFFFTLNVMHRASLEDRPSAFRHVDRSGRDGHFAHYRIPRARTVYQVLLHHDLVDNLTVRAALAAA